MLKYKRKRYGKRHSHETSWIKIFCVSHDTLKVFFMVNERLKYLIKNVYTLSGFLYLIKLRKIFCVTIKIIQTLDRR